MVVYRRPLRVLALLVVGLLAATVAIADRTSTASADHGLLCLYQHRNNGGARQCFDSTGGNLGPGLDNIASSVVNNRSASMCLYDGPNRSGYYKPILGHSYYRNLRYDAAPDGGNWNDRISSVGPAPC